MRILIVEDELPLAQMLHEHLLAQGHTADCASLLADARACLDTVDYDLLLLDLNLPDGSGLDLLRSLRAEGRALAVIILTARDRISERIAGLDAGADDYLVKPFDLDELTARVGSVLRRYGGNPSPMLRIGAFELDLVQRVVRGNAGDIALSQREWIVLETLMQRAGRVVSKAQIEERLYSFDARVESNTIEVYISRLRKKLGADVIHTLRGLGYKVAP